MTDQKVHTSIPNLVSDIIRIAKSSHTTHIHAPCFEGNHPDHDSVRLAAGIAAKTCGAILIEHSINTIRTDLPKGFHVGAGFPITRLNGAESQARKTLLREVYVSQAINPDRYRDIEASRQSESDNYSELVRAPKLLFENSEEITLTRQQLLDALSDASAQRNIFK